MAEAEVATARLGGHIGAAQAIEELRRAHVQRSRRRPLVRGTSEGDRTAARFVLERSRAGQEVTPTDIARHLEISTASVTALLDRLVRARLVTLTPHPSDRRRKIVRPADLSDNPDFYDPVTARVRELAADLSDQEEEIIARFLAGVLEATLDDGN